MALALLIYLFQIHQPTPEKWLFVALTFANVALASALAIRQGPWAFRLYVCLAVAAGVIQASPLWGMWGELALAAAGALWTAGILLQSSGRLYAVGLGAVFLGVLIYIIPKPWPTYSHEQFYLRLFTAMAFFALILGVLTWEWGKPSMRTLIALPWFAATILAGASVQWDVAYWDVALATKATWTCCLIAWLSCRSHHSARAASASAHAAERS